MQEGVFAIGVTRDVRKPDGSFAFEPFGLDSLKGPGMNWAFLDEDARPLTPELLRDFDGLYHFSAPVTAESLDGVERLTVLARHGVGLDFIDLEACTRHGIVVTITPEGVTRPMASAAVALVLALVHRLPDRDRVLRAGDWHGSRFEPIGLGLTGRTLGLVGYGRIGRDVARLLAPWDMELVVNTSRRFEEPGVEWLELDDLLRRADVLVVACALTPETRGLIDARRIGLLKPTAFLVNIARGQIVDQAALVEALREGRLAGAGLDVFDPEPLPADDPLLALPQVVGGPHSLGYTDQLMQGCVESATASLLAVAHGEVPHNVANPDVLENSAFREKLARYGSSREPTKAR